MATREAAGAKPGGRGGRSHSALPAAPQSCRGAPSTSALTCRCSPGPSSPKTHSPDEGAPHWPGGPCASCEAPHMERAEGPLGTVRPGISQCSLQLPHVDTPCALRFWNVAFLAHWDGRVSVLKTRTKKRARSCFLPGCPRPCRLLAAPTPCTGRAMQPRSLRYFGVICCRGRSCLELTQIHIPCPLEAYSPGCCCTFFLRFLQRESSLPYFPQPKKKKSFASICFSCYKAAAAPGMEGVSPKCSFWALCRVQRSAPSSLGAMSHPGGVGWEMRCVRWG